MQVFFLCGGDYTRGASPVLRPVDPSASTEERLQVALAAHFAGPTRAERRRGLSGVGPDGLNAVRVCGDRAVIDVDAREAAGGSTSSQTGSLWEVLRAHSFQFPEIELMEPRQQGSCEAFGGAVEAGECLLVTRAGRYVPG